MLRRDSADGSRAVRRLGVLATVILLYGSMIASRAGSDDRRRALRDTFKWKKRIIEEKGDGYCFFRAASRQLSPEYRKNHMLLVKDVCNWLEHELNSKASRTHIASFYLPAMACVESESEGLSDSQEDEDMDEDDSPAEARQPRGQQQKQKQKNLTRCVEDFKTCPEFHCLKLPVHHLAMNFASNFTTPFGAKLYARNMRILAEDEGGLLEALAVGYKFKRPVWIWIGDANDHPQYMFFPPGTSTNASQAKSNPPIGLLHDGETPVGHWDSVICTARTGGLDEEEGADSNATSRNRRIESNLTVFVDETSTDLTNMTEGELLSGALERARVTHTVDDPQELEVQLDGGDDSKNNTRMFDSGSQPMDTS